MAESKYSLRLAAVDSYSATFGDFSKKTEALQQEMKAQQAELKRLNQAARAADGFSKLTEKLEGTKTALQAARVEQARVTREQEVAAAKVVTLTQRHEQAAAALKTLASSTESTTAQVRAARAEEAMLARELKGASQEVAKLDTAQDKATAGIKTLQAAQRAEQNELKRLQTDLTAAGVDTGKLASEQKRLETATESATAALTAQRAKLEAVKGAQGRIEENKNKRSELRGQMVETAALAYVASRPISQAMDMQTAMADVGKVINFEGNDREEMASANLKMASDRLIASSGMTAIDLAKIEYAAGQSGIGNDQKDKNGNVDQVRKKAAIMDFTRDAAIMGSAFDVDAQTAGETMAGWRASMALSRAQTLDLADSTNYLGNNFNATAADIASVVKRYGAIGKASGMTPEQTAALSAAFLNPGTEKEIAGTGFKNFTGALTKGSAATKGQKTAWKDLGFDPEEIAADMQGNAPATIMSVLEAIKAQPVEEQNATATTLFGSESIGAIMPLLQNLEEVRRAFDMVKDKTKYATSALGENGSMMQEAAGVANTSRTGWNSFTAKLTRLSTLVGNAMLPALDAVLVPLGAMVDGISWAAEEFPSVTGALAVAAGGLAAVKVGALALKFVGLMVGQGLNRASLARVRLDANTAKTAVAADMAVARLNATLGRVGAGGAAAGGGAGGGKGAAGKAGAATTAAKAGRFSRLSTLGGKVFRPLAAAAGLMTVASGALASPALLSTVPLGGGGAEPVSRPVAASAAAKVETAAAVRAAPRLTLVPPGSAPVVPGAPLAPTVRTPPALALVPSGTSSAPAAAAVAKAPSILRPVTAGIAPVPFLPGAAPGAIAAGAAGVAPAAVAAAEKAPGLLAKAASIGGSVLGPVAKVAGRVATPLMLLSAAATAEDGLAKGDSGQVGGAIGSAAGGIGGGMAGAAIGTMIFPGVGTAIGGLIGSLAGGGAGEWIGEKLGSLVDRLKTPEAVAKDVVKSTTENNQTTFAPSITMTPTGDPAYDQRLIDQLMARLRAEMLAGGMGGGALAVRRSASLNDGSD